MTEPERGTGGADSGWDEHRRQQRRAWLRLDHRQRLQWLEAAKVFAARALSAAHARRERARSEGPR
jgi:hypothetical protein